MFRKGMQQILMLALSAVLMASAPAVAAGGPHPRQAAVVTYEGAFLARAWQWVQSLWAESGACLDPNGKCLSGTSAPPVHTDQGGCIDPNGKCTSSSTVSPVHTDQGACIDPDGRCAALLLRP